jgi:SAM-dependent methyltransferase
VEQRQFTDAFSDAAERYAEHRPTYPKALFGRLASLAPATGSAWDCGTGNGQAAIGLAEVFDAVVATDASAEQIANAHRHPRVHYRVATAEASGLTDRSMDLISVAQAVHWFDPGRFFAEVHRIARPHALIALYGYSWFYIAPALDALTDQFLLRPVQSYWSANNQLLWDAYRSINFPFEEIVPPRLAIHLAWSIDQLFDYYLTWSAVRRKITAEGDEFIVTARRELKLAWGTAQSRQVIMPLAVRLGKLT